MLPSVRLPNAASLFERLVVVVVVIVVVHSAERRRSSTLVLCAVCVERMASSRYARLINHGSSFDGQSKLSAVCITPFCETNQRSRRFP